ncbi:ATP-binding cassette domain-containing protein, partial [Streptomyces fragilis]
MSRQGDGQPPGSGVAARGLGVKGPRGWAFRGVTFEAGPGSLVAVTGPTGSGRTALLLALTGRMRTAEGTARVAGLELPRRMARVRRVSGVAHMPGVTDLDPALTVAEHLRERALVGRRYGGPAADLVRGLLRSPRARAAEDAARADAALRAVGLVPGDLPKEDRTAVRDLSRAQELRLSVALALLGRPGRPEVIAVDDADLGLSGPEREEAVALLSSLAAGGTTVLAAFREAPGEADLVVPVGEPAAPEDLPPASGRLRRVVRRGAPAAAVPVAAGDESVGPDDTAGPAGPGGPGGLGGLGGGTAADPAAPDAAAAADDAKHGRADRNGAAAPGRTAPGRTAPGR